MDDDNNTFSITIGDKTYATSNSESITVNTFDPEYTFSTDDTIDTGSEFTYNVNWGTTEFVDTMPSVSKLESMAEQYPAFKKEYEKFKHMYNLIKDDYEANNDNELPF